MARRLFLIRHGRTRANAAQQHVSSQDPTLDAVGAEQAQRLGVALAGVPITRLYSSPSRRACETANRILIARNDRTDFIVDQRLRELGFGEFEGKSESQLVEEGEGDLFHAWRQGYPPQYPAGAEHFESAARRAEEFFREEVLPREATVVAVAHSHLIRILLATCVLGIEAHFHRRLRIDPGWIAIVEWEQHTPRLTRISPP